MKKVRIIISGKVQGVGFRVAVLNQAVEYTDLKGWVKNLDSGQVEAVFCGNETDVFAMVCWCKKGAQSSHVTELTVIEEPVDSGLSSFSVQ